VPPAAERHRFTAWLTEEENRRLRAAAAQHGTSVNYMLRLMVRAALGLSLPAWARGQREQPPEHEEPTAA
jgi:hypothetical protein